MRTGREPLSEIVGADAATITAEEWPVQKHRARTQRRRRGGERTTS